MKAKKFVFFLFIQNSPFVIRRALSLTLAGTLTLDSGQVYDNKVNFGQVSLFYRRSALRKTLLRYTVRISFSFCEKMYGSRSTGIKSP